MHLRDDNLDEVVLDELLSHHDDGQLDAEFYQTSTSITLQHTRGVPSRQCLHEFSAAYVLFMRHIKYMLQVTLKKNFKREGKKDSSALETE